MISNKLLKNYTVFSSANCPVRTLWLTVKCPFNEKSRSAMSLPFSIIMTLCGKYLSKLILQQVVIK